MKEQIEEFITHLRTVKNTPENTVLAYRRDLIKLSDYLDKRGITDACNVTEDGLREYTNGLSEENYATASVIRQFTSIKAFFRYLVDNGDVSENPAENLKAPKAEKKEPRILSSLEIESLLAQDFGSTALGKRDKAIMELMYATGLRASEVVGLKLGNIDMGLGCLRMGESRLIPYGNKAKEALNDYLIDSRAKLLSVTNEQAEIPGKDATGYVFLNYIGFPMTRQALWKLLKKYTKRAGIESDISPNDLRHSFGVHLIESGANISAVESMMGYSGANTLTRYLKKNTKSKDPYDWARLRN